MQKARKKRSQNLPKKEKQDAILKFRISEKLKNKTELRADMYFKGNVSLWVRHCLENYVPPDTVK